MKFFVLGATAVAMPVTTIAVAMLHHIKEKKPPKPIEPIRSKKNWEPAVGVSTGPFYRPVIDIVSEDFDRCMITVGKDGCLWVRPNGKDEWYRVALESNLYVEKE